MGFDGKGSDENDLTLDGFARFHKKEARLLYLHLFSVAGFFELSEKDIESIVGKSFGELWAKASKPQGRVQGPRFALYQAMLKHLIDHTRGRNRAHRISKTLLDWGTVKTEPAKEDRTDAESRLNARAVATGYLKMLHDLEDTERALRGLPPGPFIDDALRNVRRAIRGLASLLHLL